MNLNRANLAQALRLHFPVKKSIVASVVEADSLGLAKDIGFEIGRASCRERVLVAV